MSSICETKTFEKYVCQNVFEFYSIIVLSNIAPTSVIQMYRNMKRVFVTCIIRIGINFWKQNCVDKQIDIYLDTLIAVTKNS